MNMHMAKKWPEKVVQRSFIKGHSFPIGLYIHIPHQNSKDTKASSKYIHSRDSVSFAAELIGMTALVL